MRIDRVKLITEMARRSITSIELAKKSGVSRVTISSMRNGKSVTKNTANHVAHALGIDVSKILEEESA
ncbi:MAG: helix-turn-helix transcriptional regulator [Oscillospiraceae bacterium]|nr:helix-turn-helix transcriptional regulator [Oscillospiraceae bacterium]MCI2191695.1 helix-turn-helix transcriptional regulator [Oscillospiraceae bacterium]MCI2205662.1 helix-turn-helix transcriptional regulator [Oscillospiraceae bacterium]